MVVAMLVVSPLLPRMARETAEVAAEPGVLAVR
jgi:hypothetical protein